MEFKNKEDLKMFIANESIYNGKLEAIEELMSFPYGWNVNGSRFKGDFEQKRMYIEWFEEINCNSNTIEEYYDAIDRKLNELLIK